MPGQYIRQQHGFVVLRSAADQLEFEDVTVGYYRGKSTGALVRASLFRLGVPADQIRSVLLGERLATVSAS